MLHFVEFLIYNFFQNGIFLYALCDQNHPQSPSKFLLTPTSLFEAVLRTSFPHNEFTKISEESDLNVVLVNGCKFFMVCSKAEMHHASYKVFHCTAGPEDNEKADMHCVMQWN